MLPKSSKNPIRRDKFCWKCSKPRTSITCTSCIRTFHQQCLSNDLPASDSASDEIICSICKSLKNFVADDNQNILQMIPRVMDFVIEDLSFVTLKDITFTKTGGRLINKIDLSKIKTKGADYESFYELRINIAWFVHNCLIEFAKNDDICRAANLLVNFVDDEIRSVKNCTECYENAYKFPDNSFVMPCEKPHLLVWARAPGWEFWPAKAMSVQNGSIHLRFFEDHTVIDLSPTECFLFSDPSKINLGNKKCRTEAYTAALNEANEYVKNIREKFGAFIYAPHQTPLNPETLEDHVNAMIGKKTTLQTLPALPQKTTTIDVVNSSLKSGPKVDTQYTTMIVDHTQTVKRSSSEPAKTRIESPKKILLVSNSSDSNEELIQQFLVKNRRKMKQKDELIEAYAQRILENTQEIDRKQNDHNNELQDLEKDFDEAKKTYESQIAKLENQIVQLKQKITADSQEKRKIYCYTCGNATNSVVFCSNQCNDNQMKKIEN